MKHILGATALLLSLAGPGLAGDAAAGEKSFSKCKACHAITDASGTDVVKGGKVGPNLWGVVGRTMGSLEGFTFGESLAAAGAAGNVWTEELIAEYLLDPTAFLKKLLSDEGAKSKMAFKLSKGGEDLAAYLATLQ